MQMYGREGERAMVDLEDEDDCAHCQFVRENVGMKAVGEVAFIHQADDPVNTIRKVKVVFLVGKGVALLCEKVTVEAMSRELPS